MAAITNTQSVRADRNRQPAEKEKPTRRVLVVIPTYNEASGVERIVTSVLEACDQADVLVVDDCSPDGTGQIVERLAQSNSRVQAFHRRGARGLGAAYMAGFRWALRRPYTHIIQMDADFSHEPAAISGLLKACDDHDLVIGSRYCAGGRTVGWPWKRKLLSFTANLYARTLLGGPIRDMTGGFKCWRREALERIDFARLRCNGYGFQVEMNYLALLAGCRIRELPITFRERAEDVSKMSTEIAHEAAWLTARLAWDRCTGQRHPALLPGKEEARRNNDDAGSGGGSSPRNVLVMCLGGIGDTVLSFAMLRQLRQRLPYARLTALAMWPQSADLLADLGIFDEILQHSFQTDRWWRSVAKLAKLHFQRFEMSILAYPANRWEYNLASWLIHGKRRVGHRYLEGDGRAGLDWLLTDRINQGQRVHNIDENIRLLSVFSPPETADGNPPDISLGPLAPECHAYAERLLDDIRGPYLGIHAGSSTAKNMNGKRWPTGRFTELCRLASEQLGLRPLLFGSGQEVALSKSIAAVCPGARVIATPSIRHTAAIMQHCSVFVSNDSALAHIAAALDVPTVMIIGPTDPNLIRPYPGHGMAVTAGVDCSPCYRPCRRALKCARGKSFDCVNLLAPVCVMQAVAGLLPKTDHAEAGLGKQSVIKSAAYTERVGL